MKRYPIYLMLAIVVFLPQCRDITSPADIAGEIFQYAWGTPEKILIENNGYHSEYYLDTTDNQLKGDTLVPLVFLEKGKVIITKLVPTAIKMADIDGSTEFLITSAEFQPDTFTYATRHYIGDQFLQLFSNTTASRVFKLLTLDIELPEIRADFQPTYEVGGYVVGDIIDRDHIEIINTDVFGDLITEQALLKEDPDVVFTIIGKKYIEKIVRGNISDDDLQSVVRSIDKIFNTDYEYEETVNGVNEFAETVKGYYWNEKDVTIFLQKVESSFEDPAQNTWTMEYSNYIITSILQNYLNFSSENT